MKEYSLVLSGTKILFSMPDGNCRDLPEPQGKITPIFNIYDQEKYEDIEIAPYFSLASRSFCFGSFLDPRLGSLQLNLLIRETTDKTTNLFKNDFAAGIIDDHNKSYESFNSRASIGIYAPKTFTSVRYNEQEWLYYEVDLQNKPYPCYSFVISDKHYLTFGFRYNDFRGQNEPWYKMAKQLEQSIMSSVRIDLSPGASS